MQRPLIGIIAIVLFAAGFFTRDLSDDAVSGACVRVGAVMAMLWFAHPQLRGVPRWLIGVSAVGVFVLLRFGPKLLLLAVPVCIVLWMLRPKTPRSNPPDGIRTR